MRKKFLLAITAIFAATVAAFCLAACGSNGDTKHVHSYVDGICTVCGEKLEEATGLKYKYKLTDDEIYYVVTGIGTEKRRL